MILLFTLILFSSSKHKRQIMCMNKDDTLNPSLISMSGGQIKSTHHAAPSSPANIPKWFPQVSVLTNEIIRKIPIESFVWMEKTDGLHVNILIESNHVYSMSYGETTHLFELPGKYFVKRSILDCELYNDIYHVFDAAMIDGDDVSNLLFTERMEYAALLIDESHVTQFVVDKYYPVTNWAELITFINSHHISPITNNRIDGVICRRIDRQYFVKPDDPACFKLKSTIMTTIDFYVRYQKDDGVFYLYLYGTCFDYIFNMKTLPRNNKYMFNHTGVDPREKPFPKNMYVLFSSPYFENMHEFKLRNNWDRTNYPDELIEQIDELMTSMISNPLQYDEQIIEMSMANDGWVPIRIRDDKEISNKYYVGLCNSGSIFSPVDPKYTYRFISQTSSGSQSQINSDELYTKLIQGYSDLINISIEHDINNIKRKLSVLIVSDESCIDKVILNTINSLFNSGMNNMFMMSGDCDMMVQAVNKCINVKNLSYKSMLPSYSENKSNSINVNCIGAPIDTEYIHETIDEIKLRQEYPKYGFDVIVTINIPNNADDNMQIIVNKLLKKGGTMLSVSLTNEIDLNYLKLKEIDTYIPYKWFKDLLPDHTVITKQLELVHVYVMYKELCN